MSETTMTRAELAEQVAYYKHLAEAATAREQTFRKQLVAAAHAEYLAEGITPTWRIQGLGVVSGTTRDDAIAVADQAVLTDWVRAHHPEHIVESIAPVFVNQLLKTCTVDDGLVVTPGGDEVAGLKFVAGGQFKGISCRFDDTAKTNFAGLAEMALARVTLFTEGTAPSTDDSQMAGEVPPAAADPMGAFFAAAETA